MIFIKKYNMKIIIKESQLKRLMNEIGGYDDAELMGQHAGEIQSKLLIIFTETTNIIANFLNEAREGNLTKENYLAFTQNMTYKVENDLQIIDSLIDEIYIDVDYKESILNYRKALQMFQNKLRLIYKDGLGLGLDMSKNELSQIIIEEIDKLSTLMEPLAILFQQIHRRFRNRLGFN